MAISIRLSGFCDMVLAFWAAPRMPSLLKLGVLCAFKEDGDLRG